MRLAPAVSQLHKPRFFERTGWVNSSTGGSEMKFQSVIVEVVRLEVGRAITRMWASAQTEVHASGLMSREFGNSIRRESASLSVFNTEMIRRRRTNGCGIIRGSGDSCGEQAFKSSSVERKPRTSQWYVHCS